MRKKALFTILLLLIAFSSVSQIATDSVCFDFETAKKIELDLIDLDDYRQKDVLQSANISDFIKTLQKKDSIIRNKDLEIELINKINTIDSKRENLESKNKKWVKWTFGVIGFLIGIFVF